MQRIVNAVADSGRVSCGVEGYIEECEDTEGLGEDDEEEYRGDPFSGVAEEVDERDSGLCGSGHLASLNFSMQ